jgi:hypothetical protein
LGGDEALPFNFKANGAIRSLFSGIFNVGTPNAVRILKFCLMDDND